ncbi:branched-chain-amino-acid transaminase [Coprinopsis cinerea okayama7|uniref:Branched-chain-amino-acid aminotransferase n=1 Tax=Coprinopsis cinerea (strain Okayama-7 / 130 / ATCC MYA-4618 / FGSC 9003) TaxID=240176 RepID=A8N0B4_COPC7|nr:branched-chain-amino-acid transaminase [Coprinopsis cinerea okayama7\|eukprot:XP_001828326.2 branched-chain-amino-acid transaminase [Coprinopsis cinerea okayama7\
MAIQTPSTTTAAVAKANGSSSSPGAPTKVVGNAPLDASKLVVTLAKTLKPLPDPESLVFGQTKTDHMLTVHYNPKTGWQTPEIRPYANLELDPMSSCFQYCPNVFEGMKAYIGPDGEPRLFRPERNMERMAQSAARVALPPFDTSALLELIKQLVRVEKRWIPTQPGYSLYIRPTIIGTRDALGVSASDSALIYAVVTPAGPYFKGESRAISLLAVSETVRAWPGGTGGYKLGLNYAPGFAPQREALQKGYDQILWLLGDKITEVGAMNVFVIVKRDDGDLDAFTPPLDGTILPGLTRASVLQLLQAHTSPSHTFNLPNTPSSLKIHTTERVLTMSEIVAWSEQGKLLEVFGVGTAVVVCPVGKIGYEGKDMTLPRHEGGLGPVAKAVSDAIISIQTGRQEFEGWSVPV